MEFIDLKRQYEKLQEDIQKNIKGVINSTQFILGTPVRELEQTLANYVGASHAIGVGSGTEALLLSLMALDVQPGDEVITSPFSFISTAEVISILGAKPVFVDILPKTYNIDHDLIEQYITEKTKAILPVSIFGKCPEMDTINSVAEKHNIPVIEDACQSFGATYKNNRSCNLSTIGCTSFYPSKPLGCYGDGGMIFTNDESLAEKFLRMRNHGFDSEGLSQELGFNSRLDSLQASILLAKFSHFEDELERRIMAGRYYMQHLAHIPGIRHPNLDIAEGHIYSQFTIETSARNELGVFLKERNIPTAVYYKVPLHLEKTFKKFGYRKGEFPECESTCERVVSLPLHPYIQEEELETVFESIMEFMG